MVMPSLQVQQGRQRVCTCSKEENIVGLQVDQQHDGSRCRTLATTGRLMPLNFLCTRSGLSDAFQKSECYFWTKSLAFCLTAVMVKLDTESCVASSTT